MKIDIRQISYQRVFNLGNFEAERIELVASVDCDEENPVEDLQLAYDKLKSLVYELHRRGQ